MLLFFVLAAAALQPPAEAPAPVPGQWAWLNIPDQEGPGARFSYETAVRRHGAGLEIRYRFNQFFDPRGRATAIEARIALDCVGRTFRTLEFRSLTRGVGLLYNAGVEPVRPNSREDVLMRLLCPAGIAPRPAPPAGQEG